MKDNENVDELISNDNLKKLKFNVFPAANIRTKKELGRDLKDFKLYYLREVESEDYPFDKGLKCLIF